MTTDFQRARTALGARLLELRTEGGLTGRQLAARLGWTQSKISKLESGKQTATAADLSAWAEGVGNPHAAAELKARLLGAESSYRTWRRQLAAGHRPRQDQGIEQSRKTSSDASVRICPHPRPAPDGRLRSCPAHHGCGLRQLP